MQRNSCFGHILDSNQGLLGLVNLILNMKNIYILTLGCILLSFFACRTDEFEVIEIETDDDLMILVEAEFNGFVFNSNGDPIIGAQVSLGEELAFSDDRGYFKISNQVDQNEANFDVSASLYQNAYLNSVPSQEGRGQVRIELLQPNIIDVFMPESGSTLNFQDQLNINIQANTRFNLNETVYTDDILAEITFFELDKPNIHESLGSSIIARNASNNRELLNPFTMVSIEAKSNTDEDLSLIDQISVVAKIPDNHINDAPSEIDLWYFDQQKKQWEQRGRANLVNGNYEFQIDKLGRWMSATSGEFTLLSGKVEDLEDLTNALIRVTDANETSRIFMTITDERGYYWLNVPTGAPLILEVLDECLNVKGITELNGLTQETKANIELIKNGVETIRLSGNLICGSESVEDGYVMVESSFGETYFSETDQDGRFDFEVLDCGAEYYQVTGVDYSMNEIGMPILYQSDPRIRAENLEACNGELAFFFSYKFQDREIVFRDLEINGDTEFGNNLAFDIDFVHQTDTDEVSYTISVLFAIPFANFQIVSISNSESATESYRFEPSEIQIIDHGFYLEGNVEEIEIINSTTGETETGSIHFRLQKL